MCEVSVCINEILRHTMQHNLTPTPSNNSKIERDWYK